MKLLRVWTAIIALSFAGFTWAQAYPTKPVRLIVATGPGSASDVISRMLTDAVSKNTGGKFVVENRAGGGGGIGLAAAARSAPDGYTLVMGNLGGTILNPFLYEKLDYDAEKDFESIVLVAGIPFVFAVTPSYPVNSLQELIAAAKAQPNTINVGLDSTSVRIVHALFEQATGTKLFQVQYSTPAAAITDTLSGRVPVIIETYGALRALIASGKLKPLAISTRTSSELLPGVRSVAEQGVSGFGEVIGWIGLQAPRGTPREILAYLNTEFNKALTDPAIKKRLFEMGFEGKSGTAQEFQAWVLSERARFGPLIKAAGIKNQ